MNWKKVSIFSLPGLGLLVLGMVFPVRGSALSLASNLVTLVENVWEPAQHRVQVWIPAGNYVHASVASLNAYTVPAGKRLVIEHVSGQCVTPHGFTQARLLASANGVTVPFLIPVQSEASNPGEYASNIFGVPIRAYADPGTTVQFSFLDHRSLSQDWQCSASLSGFLVDLPLN